MNQKLKEAIATAIKKRKNIKYKCFAKGCSGYAVNSHSQSLSNALKKISEGGHLIRFKPRSFINEENDIDSYFQEIGINQASAFKGFCSKHDTEYFKIVDSFEPKNINKETLARLAFRTFAYEERTKEDVLFFIGCFVKEAYHLCDVSYAQYFAEGIKNHLEVTRPYYLGRFMKMFDSHNYKQINGLVFVTDKLIPLSCSSIIDPTMTNAESLTQHPLKKPLNLIFFNLIPQIDSSAIIFTYFQEQKKKLKIFITLFKNLENIVFNCCEEILMAPAFYRNLNPELKNKIINGLKGWASWNKVDFPDLLKVKLKSPISIEI
jgi:hypothetical protein